METRTMSKALSLKLQDDVFADADRIAHETDLPRNAYINKAVAFYNGLHKRRILRQGYAREAALVEAESMRVLREFEAFEEGVPE
jgi:predicted transcriptional regulator